MRYDVFNSNLEVNVKKIIILGGGTAGWMTALFARKFFPNDRVIVIESDAIGILGAGEATVPIFHRVMRTLDIDIMELIAKTGASIKGGINFENWNGDGKSYFHSFGIDERYLDLALEPQFDEGAYHQYLSHLIAHNKDLNEWTYPAKVIQNDKVPFILEGDNVQSLSPWSIHFNSHNVGKYLREKGEERCVERVEGIVTSVKSAPNGDISALVMESGEVIETDFVFDCSGFARLLIGKHYNTPWKSYEAHLPCNEAQAFFLPREEKLYSYTKAIAMKNGWQWNIPLQERFGCGYVYDNRYTTNEEVRAEIEEMHGDKDIQWMKHFKFNAGCYEDVWVNNCIAVGLSSSFLEPLESTSIWISALQLFHLYHYIPDLMERNEYRIKGYNKLIAQTNEDAMAFIYLHYLTKRDDSAFWRDFRGRMEMPQKVKDMWDYITKSPFDVMQYETVANINDLFYTISWMHICEGLELFDRELFLKRDLSGDMGSKFSPPLDAYKHKLDWYVEQSLDHRTVLNMINDRYK